MISAIDIIEKAKESGYDKCGIIPLDKMAAYDRKLAERTERFPETKSRIGKLRDFAFPQRKYPWVKAVVVCAFWYGKYRIPENLQGKIAKYYLTDGRRNKASEGYQASIAFEEYLRSAGLTIAFDRDFGITALRWAAQEAGLGIIRKNNFFYAEKGSYYNLEAFLINAEMEYTLTSTLPPCSDKCHKCIRSCPSGSLSEPFSMNRNLCISDLTTWSGWDLTQEPLHSRLGNWIYGCDACQDVCPYNQKSRTESEEFPGLQKLAKNISLIRIVESDYTYLEQELQPLLWYLPAEKSWRYKTNALNAMLNDYKPEYDAVIRRACKDDKEPVRKMAAWVLKQLKTQKSDCQQ